MVTGVAPPAGYGATDADARIFTFGSYRLGVHGPGDLSAFQKSSKLPLASLWLCLAPSTDVPITFFTFYLTQCPRP